MKLYKHHNKVMYSMEKKINIDKNSKNEYCRIKGREHDEPNAPLFSARLELFCCPLPFRSAMDKLKQRSLCLIASTNSVLEK